jgi:hypothetical protein
MLNSVFFITCVKTQYFAQFFEEVNSFFATKTQRHFHRGARRERREIFTTNFLPLRARRLRPVKRSQRSPLEKQARSAALRTWLCRGPHSRPPANFVSRRRNAGIGRNYTKLQIKSQARNPKSVFAMLRRDKSETNSNYQNQESNKRRNWRNRVYKYMRIYLYSALPIKDF